MLAELSVRRRRAAPAGEGDPSAADHRRTTSRDVARVAGVSASAVSRAFTAGASVAPEKRARILDVASALGYRPNVMARAVATRRSNVVGLILFNETNRHHRASCSRCRGPFRRSASASCCSC